MEVADILRAFFPIFSLCDREFEVWVLLESRNATWRGVEIRASKSPKAGFPWTKYGGGHPKWPKLMMRNTNLKTSLARVTLLLFVAIDSDLASGGLSARRFSFTASHYGRVLMKIIVGFSWICDGLDVMGLTLMMLMLLFVRRVVDGRRRYGKAGMLAPNLGKTARIGRNGRTRRN
jgi:hypothetical protein